MTYDEFDKKVKALGNETWKTNNRIKITCGEYYRGNVNCRCARTLDVNTTGINLIKLMVELAETPLDEREELYYIRFPFISNPINFLNQGVHSKICFTSGPREFITCKTKFTLNEIKEIDENLLPFAVKVEDYEEIEK